MEIGGEEEALLQLLSDAPVQKKKTYERRCACASRPHSCHRFTQVNLQISMIWY
jgi:hypothetical protein